MVWKAVARTVLAMTLCPKAGRAEATCRSREERAIDAIVDAGGAGCLGSQLVRPRAAWLIASGNSTAGSWSQGLKATTMEQRESRENGCRTARSRTLGNRNGPLPIAWPLMSAEQLHREKASGRSGNSLLPSAVPCGPASHQETARVGPVQGSVLVLDRPLSRINFGNPGMGLGRSFNTHTTTVAGTQIDPRNSQRLTSLLRAVPCPKSRFDIH